MSLLPIDQLIVPTLADEIETAVLDLCATGGLPTSSWQPGSVIRTFIAETSAGFEMKSLIEVEYAKGGFGDLASGIWVKMWAQSIYNVFYIPAEPATGGLRGTNNGLTSIDLNPGDLTVAHKSTGKTYRNQNTISIPAGTTTPDDGLIELAADEVGTDSDAAPGDITIVVSGNPGLVVTNPKAVLGADEEANEALVIRTRAKLGSFSPNGPKSAYDYVARTPLDSFPVVEGTLLTATSTPITRSKTTADPETGDITVYIATATGAPIGADVDLVTLGLRRWAEPWCVSSGAAAASENVIPVSVRVWIKTSLTIAQVQSAIGVALSRYFKTIPVGGVVVDSSVVPGAVYVEALQYIARTALPGIELVSVILPSADVVVQPFEVPVLGDVNVVVTSL